MLIYTTVPVAVAARVDIEADPCNITPTMPSRVALMSRWIVFLALYTLQIYIYRVLILTISYLLANPSGQARRSSRDSRVFLLLIGSIFWELMFVNLLGHYDVCKGTHAN